MNGNYDNFKSLYKSVIASCPLIHPVDLEKGVFSQAGIRCALDG